MTAWIEHILKKAYAISGEIKLLAGEADLNVKVSTATDTYLLKIMRPGCAPEFVDKQIAALSVLSRSDIGIKFQRVQLSVQGAPRITVTDEAGDKRIAWLLSFTPGTLLADVQYRTPALSFDIGSGVAKIDQALAGFDHPGLRLPLKWNLTEAGWIKEHIEQIESPERRTQIEQITDHFVKVLSPALTQWSTTPIHNDANDMNLLVHGKNFPRLSGIIDFGDSTFAPRICSPAIAAAYLMMDVDDPIVHLEAVVAGYHSVTPLTDEELDHLYPLALMRLGVSVTNSAIEKKNRPDDPYVVISEAPAWALLDTLANINRDDIAKRLRAAVKTPSKIMHAHTKKLVEKRFAVGLSNQKLSYAEPLHVVRGEKHFLYGADGRRYIDAYNNVPHVGHAHPAVIDAVQTQIAQINTNTRYIQDIHLDYADRILALAPPELTKVIFVNSASEANELAMRLARAATGRKDMIVMDHSYHGCTTGAIDLSPYKFNRPNMPGAPDWVEMVRQPDPYRGPLRNTPDQGPCYAQDLTDAIARMVARSRAPAGFICECLPSVGGQIVMPEGYLKQAYKIMRDAGGLAIADDVQTGLGRLGKYFWGFEQQGVTPDVLVLGKPLGNGYPIGAVLTTDKIADAFANGPEFFSTFGGSSGACAAGLAVLDVLEAENLPAKAHDLGNSMLSSLQSLAEHHEVIGDVRGYGLFLGVDLVTDRETRAPATKIADTVKNTMRERGVLIGVEGPHDNVLKIRPPMSFDQAAADQVIEILDGVLGDTVNHQ